MGQTRVQTAKTFEGNTGVPEREEDGIEDGSVDGRGLWDIIYDYGTVERIEEITLLLRIFSGVLAGVVTKAVDSSAHGIPV